MEYDRFRPGDKVRLKLSDKEQDGVYLQSSDSSIVLLKLDSGYNIGIPKEHILAGRVLEKSEEKTFDRKVENGNGKPKIGLIVTGGTIASKLDPKTGGVKPLTDVNEFLHFYPEIAKHAYVKSIEIPFMIASESMESSHWLKIAEVAQKLLNDDEIRGIVITHGTDTLHYTAAALSFFLKSVKKPVVLTYSQRSIDRASSDAHLNLECATRFALSDCAEVVLVGHASSNDDYCYAMLGTKVRKMHTSRRDAFKPINTRPIAKVFPDKIEFLEKYKKSSNGKTELDAVWSDKVALVKFYPGQDPSILDFYALKYKGIVIEMLGLGHVAGSDALGPWLSAIKKHIKNGLFVCAAAQTINGRLDPLVYSNGRELVDAGVIFLEDMLAETAFVKLGWVLGHYGWKKYVKDRMLEDYAGELNNKIGFD